VPELPLDEDEVVRRFVQFCRATRSQTGGTETVS